MRDRCFIYVGRFQPFHSGHLRIIDEYLKIFSIEDLLILIGSSNTINEKNPFTYSQRKYFITKTLDESFKNNQRIKVNSEYNIAPLPDVNDDECWIGQIQDIASMFLGYKSNYTNTAFIGGLADDFYDCQRSFLKMVLSDRSRELKEVSGTNIRKFLKSFSKKINEFPEESEKFTTKYHDLYDDFKVKIRELGVFNNEVIYRLYNMLKDGQVNL